MILLVLSEPWGLLSQGCAVPMFNASFFGHKIKGARFFQQFFRAAILHNLPIV